MFVRHKLVKLASKVVGVFGYVVQYGCITHCTFEHLGDFVVCSGPSMEPTLHSNNILITERIMPKFYRIKRGDIVIAVCPTNPRQHICKRVVALPGDKIISTEPAFTDFDPFGRKLLPISGTTIDSEGKGMFRREIVVPRGYVWLEGDNSKNSSDSRYYGPIPQGLIRSRAVCRIWPFNEFKLLI